MIILKVHIQQFVVFDTERQPPVTGHVKAPRSPAVACQHVDPPERPSVQFSGNFHLVEDGEHGAQLLDGVGRKTLRVAVLIKAPERFVAETPYPQYPIVRCRWTLVNVARGPPVPTRSIDEPTRIQRTPRRAAPTPNAPRNAPLTPQSLIAVRIRDG